MSLWDTLRLWAKDFVDLIDDLRSLENSLNESEPNAVAPANLVQLCKAVLVRVRAHCGPLKVRSALLKADRIETSLEFSRDAYPQALQHAINDLRMSIEDDLTTRKFFYVADAEYYEHPFATWTGVSKWIPDAMQDIEEAGKSFALERYGAAVFHLMRIAEYGAIELGKLAGSTDPKSTFGSSLDLVLRIVQNTTFSDLSPEIQKHFNFLQAILPQMYAVKNAWRNKADHAGGRIVPTESQPSREVAASIYSATARLMYMLSSELSGGSGKATR